MLKCHLLAAQLLAWGSLALGGQPALGEGGIWVDVSDQIGSRYSDGGPSGGYNPCADRPPQTQTVIEKVEGFTRDETSQVELTKKATYDLVGADAIVVGSVNVQAGANVDSRNMLDAVLAGDAEAKVKYFSTRNEVFKTMRDAFFSTYAPKEQKYEVYCVLPVGYQDPVDDEGNLTGESAEQEVLIDQFWVPIVSEEVVEFELMVMISQYLAPPETDFLMRNPEHGWLTVKVPTELMVENVQPVTLFASVTNRTGSASASITATPEGLIFDAGETGEDGQSGGVACSWAELESMSCMYEYFNSSSIESDKAFDTQSTVLWRVATSAAAPVDMATTSSLEVQVAEVQAIGTG